VDEELQRKETIIDQEIVNELIDLTPEWWNEISLSVTYYVENGVEKYSHVITSPERNSEPIMPSEKLFEATYKLGQLFRAHSRHWQRVIYTVKRVNQEEWKYTAEFTY
jgi:hypothetical protein